MKKVVKIFRWIALLLAAMLVLSFFLPIGMATSTNNTHPIFLFAPFLLSHDAVFSLFYIPIMILSILLGIAVSLIKFRGQNHVSAALLIVGALLCIFVSTLNVVLITAPFADFWSIPYGLGIGHYTIFTLSCLLLSCATVYLILGAIMQSKENRKAVENIYNSSTTFEEKLKKLEEYKNNNTVTKEEYDLKRAELIKQLEL